MHGEEKQDGSTGAASHPTADGSHIIKFKNNKNVGDSRSPSAGRTSSSIKVLNYRNGTSPILFGRMKEESLLKEAFDRVCSTQVPELVLIAGPAGAGKTALADTVLKKIARTACRTTPDRPVVYTMAQFAPPAAVDISATDNAQFFVLSSAMTEYIEGLIKNKYIGEERVRESVGLALLSFVYAHRRPSGGSSQQDTDKNADKSITKNFRRLCRKCHSHESADDNVVAEKSILFQYIPILERVLYPEGEYRSRRQISNDQDNNADNNRESTPPSTNWKMLGRHAQECFRRGFSRLVEELTQLAPWILFLDDLHWADLESMETLQTLLSDRYSQVGDSLSSITRCLVVASHLPNTDVVVVPRINHVPGSGNETIGFKELRLFERVVRDMEHSKMVNIITIELKYLTELDLQKMLRLVLHKPADDIAKIIFEQSCGRLPDILQLLRLLFDLGYFTHDQTLLSDNDHGPIAWQWDIEAVFRDFGSIEATQIVLRDAVLKLPRLVQETLKVACIIGDAIDDSALDLYLQTHTGQYLEEAAAIGLLLFLPEYGGYRFAHDWVRQAVYDLIPTDEQNEFHLKVGRKLWKMGGAAAWDKNIFVVASIMNKGSKLITEDRERSKLAALNLRAGEKAAAVSVLSDASRFLRRGIQLLGPNRWTEHYELALEIYSAASETEARNGQYERALNYIEEVIQNAKCLEDQVRVHASLILSMEQQGNILEATNVGLDFLSQVGHAVPKPTRFTVVKEAAKVEMILKRSGPEKILNMPRMKDPFIIRCFELLSYLQYCSYASKSPYTKLIVLHCVLMTLQYGLHGHSATSLSMYGMLFLGATLDAESAYRYGQLSIAIAEKMQSRKEIAKAYLGCGTGISHWTRPLRESIEYLTRATRLGLAAGSRNDALYALTQKCAVSIFSGDSLVNVKELVEEGVYLSRVYQAGALEIILLMQLQFLQCCLGETENPARLSGSVITFDETLTQLTKAKNTTWIVRLYFYSLELAYLFGDYNLARTMSEEICKLEEPLTSNHFGKVERVRNDFTKAERVYKEGLVAITQARKGVDARKHENHARKVLKLVASWAADSPRTFRQKELFLEAELLSLKPKASELMVLSTYENALEVALAEGYRNDAALIQERAADYLYLQVKDINAANDRWESALELYAAWGAKAKAIQLRSKIDNMREGKNCSETEGSCEVVIASPS